MILLSQTMPSDQLPFDIRHLNITMYEDDKFSLLQLREDLSEIVNKISPIVDRPPAKRNFPIVSTDEVEAARSSLFHFSADARRYAVRFFGECPRCASRSSSTPSRLPLAQENGSIVRGCLKGGIFTHRPRR